MRKLSITPKNKQTLIVLSGILLATFLLALVSGSLFFSLGDSSADSVSSDISVEVDAVMAITTNTPTLSIPIMPTPSGTLAMNDLTVTVSTNNQTGYTLSMNSETEDTDLAHITMPDAIPSTTAPFATPAALGVNTWGYSLAASPSNFSAIPALSAPYTIASTAAPGQNSATGVTFGANIDSTVAAGTYLSTMVFTATANYVPPILAKNGAIMQTVTNATCPTDRIYVVDARNDQPYYVQKIPNSGGDGIDLCWMLSNLRYAGGGANTYGDTKTLVETTSGSTAWTNTTANVHTNVGGSADYTNTNANGGFYGYIYNWCAAMGGQTNACNSSSTTGFDTAVSICPAGWRLPTGEVTTGEFTQLNNTINSGSTGNDSGLRTNWLAVYAGGYVSGLGGAGSDGYYWSSTVGNAANARNLNFNASLVYPANNYNKIGGFSVRCVLD